MLYFQENSKVCYYCPKYREQGKKLNFLRACYASNNILSVFTHVFNSHNNPVRQVFLPHFTDEENESWKEN